MLTRSATLLARDIAEQEDRIRTINEVFGTFFSFAKQGEKKRMAYLQQQAKLNPKISTYARIDESDLQELIDLAIVQLLHLLRMDLLRNELRGGCCISILRND
jgi:hypothetical protein